MAKHSAMALSVGLGAAILYLGAHAVTGRQGLVAFVGLQEQERVLEGRVGALEEERIALETRASRLRPGQDFDTDYLDERARITLAAGDSDELIFALDQ